MQRAYITNLPFHFFVFGNVIFYKLNMLIIFNWMLAFSSTTSVFNVKGTNAMAGNRTRVNCLEGSYAHHYTTIATHYCETCPDLELPLQKHSLTRMSRKGEEREGRGGKSGRERRESAVLSCPEQLAQRPRADHHSHGQPKTALGWTHHQETKTTSSILT